MSREIKFRAWDKSTKRMVEGYFYIDASTGIVHSHKDAEPPLIRFDCEPMQYTGLKDKNGNEAYHKDIIRRSDGLYILEWHDNLAGWYLQPLWGGWHGVTRGDMSLMCEVIGNVYLNPELLK